MNIPQPLSLSNQSFNSEFVEFVWKFPVTENKNDQVILQVHKNGVLYLEGGLIDTFGDYMTKGGLPEYYVEDVEPEYFLGGDTNTNLDYIKRYLTFEEIVNLSDQAIKFLNE